MTQRPVRPDPPIASVVWRWLRGAGAVVVAAAAVEYGVIPLVVRARSEVSVLDNVSWPLLVVAAILETASLAAYTRLTQVLLDPPHRLPFGTQWRIDLAGYGISHAVPGGGATASGLRVKLMVDRGVDPAAALALTVLQFALSVLGLMSVWLLGGLMAVPRTGLTTTMVVLLVATALALSALELASRYPRISLPRLRRPGRRVLNTLVPGRWRGAVRSAVVRGVASVRTAEVTRAGVAWAVANWMLDAICLWVCLRAFGATVPIELVIASYGLANAVALMPITPGGLGIVESLLVPAMAAAGAPAGVAVAGVLTWRLLQYWLPMPVGGCCWASLSATRRPRPPETRNPHTKWGSGARLDVQPVADEGFEPSKATPTDLQSAPIGRSGNLPGSRAGGRLGPATTRRKNSAATAAHENHRTPSGVPQTEE